MSFIPSASTVTLTAYLTNKGRDYYVSLKNGISDIGVRYVLDNSGTVIIGDRFKIQDFSLYDSDTNYTTGERLESGELPALAGFKQGGINNNSAEEVLNKKNILYTGSTEQ